MRTGTPERKLYLHYHGIWTDFRAQAVGLPLYTRCQPFSAPQLHSILNARKIPHQPQRPSAPASQHPSTGRHNETPAAGVVPVVTNKSRNGGYALLSRGLLRLWWARRGQAQRAADGHAGRDCLSPAGQIGVRCLRPGAAVPWGLVDGGGQHTKSAGTKQQVAPVEVIRITFNGGAGSIFSPVSAEGPGAALLMLQGTRGTH